MFTGKNSKSYEKTNKTIVRYNKTYKMWPFVHQSGLNEGKWKLFWFFLLHFSLFIVHTTRFKQTVALKLIQFSFQATNQSIYWYELNVFNWTSFNWLFSHNISSEIKMIFIQKQKVTIIKSEFESMRYCFVCLFVFMSFKLLLQYVLYELCKACANQPPSTIHFN